MARAFGSYPKRRWFESNCRYQCGPVVKRLRHRPFTAVTRVRFSPGSPFSSLRVIRANFFGRIAQLVRAFASHARGRGFESPYVHQKKECSLFGCVPFLFGIREGTRTRKGLSVKENMPVSYFQRRAARRLAASRRRWYNAGKSPYVHHTETRMGAGFFQYRMWVYFLFQLCVRQNYDSFTTML